MILHSFIYVLIISPLPYLFLKLHFRHVLKSFHYRTSEAYRHKKGTFLRNEASTFGTKMELFPLF